MNPNQLKLDLQGYFGEENEVIIHDEGDKVHLIISDGTDHTKGVDYWCANNDYTPTILPANDEKFWYLESNSRKQFWNVVSSSGTVLNTDPYFGSMKEANSFMLMTHKHCELKLAECVDLSKITFVKQDDSDVIKCMDGELLMFSLIHGPNKDEVTLLGKHELPDDIVEIELLMDLPAFAKIASCQQCHGTGEFIRDVDFGPDIASNNDPTKCECVDVLLK